MTASGDSEAGGPRPGVAARGCALVVMVAAWQVTTLWSCQKKESDEGKRPTVTLAQPMLPTVQWELAGRRYTVELAYRRETRRQGMMFRPAPAPGTGMLFIFRAPGIRQFYMKNCLADLDIVFLADDGVIVRTATMTRPQAGKPLRYYSSGAPIRYALELPAGTCSRLGLKTGQRVPIPEEVARIEAEPD